MKNREKNGTGYKRDDIYLEYVSTGENVKIVSG